MKWLDKYNVLRPYADNKYKINWLKKAPSKGAQSVKDFIYAHANDYVWYEEYRIPRTLYRIDFLCPQLGIAVEFHGKQHDEYNKFMHGSKLGFLRHIKRDIKKIELLERNGIKTIEIRDEDLPLTKKWFLDNHQILF